jgi:hypothetical protein
LVVLAYADCGTYGTLDEVCERLQLELLRGFTVMMLFAGAEKMQKLLSD